MSSLPIPNQRSNSTATKTQLDSHSAWQAKLDASIACLRLLLSPTQASSKAWKPVIPVQSSHSTNNSIANIDAMSIPSTSQNRLDNNISPPLPASVKVHKRSAAARGAKDSTAAGGPPLLLPPGSSQSADIFRAVCHVPLPKQFVNSAYQLDDLQDAFRRILSTPECRPLWDHMVEDSEVVEELDASTRISRTVFRLGWPASHRDAITISRHIMEGQTLIDVSTSLPRSPDAPAYLRPAPPYVRSHINLFAWCLQPTQEATLKVSLFWSWDLKGAWLGMPTGGLGAQLPAVVTSLVSQVANDASRVPYLSSFGRNVEVTRRKFDPTRDMISVEYQVICEGSGTDEESDDETLIWSLPAVEGWDLHITVRPLIANSTSKASSAWSCKALRERRGSEWSAANVTVRIVHGEGQARSELEQGVRGTITIQRIAASHEVRLRLNDNPCAIEDIEAPDRSIIVDVGSLESLEKHAVSIPTDDSASVSGFSLRSDTSSHSTVATINAEDVIKRAETPSNLSERIIATQTVPSTPKSGKSQHDRSQALASLIRRNYIYFTSLLQEPEAKWKHHSDSRGVTITQLDSIDPTLVVYRAEATFVGVSVWDIFATLANPGVKSTWDKGAEEVRLVEDLGDASKLWWSRIRAAWPVSSRDNVTIETSYQSPSSIHVFSFSTDDRGLFPSLPKIELGTIRTQVDLRGWSIESLSPTTVHITLIEQSDPKGWTSKSQATPSAMTSAVAGVGDFAIKRGGPPIITRLLGAKTKLIKYDHEKSNMRMEYELAVYHSTEDENASTDGTQHVECEIRCDLETWANALDLVVDPPPINVSCLRRHKLSQGGSGLWLTIEHVAASLEDDLARITVRKASSTGKEKGVVHVNGARIKVDVIELREEEVASLKDKKRTKPRRVPLDLINGSPRAPARKRNVGVATSGIENVAAHTKDILPVPRVGSPTPLSTSQDSTLSTLSSETNDVFSDERPRQPMTCALDVLFLLRRIHAERSPDPAGNPAGWALVSQRNGLFIRRRMMQSISQTIHVQRGDKVVEGLTAEDILTAVSSMSCRRLWDEKVDSSMLLESFGNGATTGFFTSKASFPFRGRAFHLANITARSGPSSINLGSAAAPTVYFHASASFPDRNSPFSPLKINPTGLPLGKVLIDGWILETLDPYSSTLNFQIPSTRCTHVVAVDYAGSLPIAVNTMWNSNLPRSILAVEDFVKSKGTLPSIRSPPSCIVVLGDGRDEDRNSIWNMEDDKMQRACTLLVNTFNPVDKVYSVLVKIDSKAVREVQLDRPNVIAPLPRKAVLAPSISSATKGLAASPLLASPMGALDAGTGSLQGLVKVASDEQEGTISRTTSVTSLRSITKSRPSTLRANVKKPFDLVLMDIEVELRHYNKGYEVITSSQWNNTEEQPMSLHAAPEPTQELALQVASYDLPPSAVLAATLDPSARPRKHLLRVTLPTATLFSEARDDPLSGSEPDDAPKWYQDLREKGACIRLIIRPLGGGKEGTPSPDGESIPSVANSEIDSQQVAVVYQGMKIPVTHVNQTSAMLQRESEKEEGHAKLKRVAPSLALKAEVDEKRTENILDDRLPTLLQNPIAAANEMRRVEGEDAREAQRSSIVEAKENIGQMSAATSTTEIADSSTPIAKKTVDAGQLSTLLSSSAATPIMGILSGYPLSRLGASTAVTTAVANGGVFSRTVNGRVKDRLQVGPGASSHHSDKDGEKKIGALSNGEKGGQDSSSSNNGTTIKAEDGMPGNLVLATTETIRRRMSDVRFTLSTLILVAIIAFLLGSLFRSLLEPADFIFVDKMTSRKVVGDGSGSSIQEAARGEVMKLLDSSSSHYTGVGGRTNVVRRELKRLIQLRGLGGWDLVIAAARW